MTLNECLTALEHHLLADPDARCWITTEGALRITRTRIGAYCPITYTAEREGKGDFDCAEVEDAAVAIALAHRNMLRLMHAADHTGSPRLRQRLEALWVQAGQKGTRSDTPP